MPEHAPPYNALASLYDTLMGNVDYDAWADYVDELIQIHRPHSRQILEIACGTGTLALSLDELGTYDVTGTDLSEQMIRMARRKAAEALSPIRFETADMTDLHGYQDYDTVLCLFDSINYLTEPELISLALDQMHTTLVPDGLLIFDISTAENSRQSIKRLNRPKPIRSGPWQFRQESRFDEESCIHLNRFRIESLESTPENGQTWIEEHRQRIYSMEEVTQLVEQSPFRILHKYDNFRLQPATHKSLRITFVCQC